MVAILLMFSIMSVSWSQGTGGTPSPDPAPTGGTQGPSPDPFPGPPKPRAAYKVARRGMIRQAKLDNPGFHVTEVKLSHKSRIYRERWRAFCGYVSMESEPADPSIGTAAISTEYRVIVRRYESTGRLHATATPSTKKHCVSPRP
jgi:hypothetical protein